MLFTPAAHAAAETFKEQSLYPHIHARYVAEDAMTQFTAHMREQLDESRHYTLADYERLRRVDADLFARTGMRHSGRAGGLAEEGGRQEEGDGRREEGAEGQEEESGLQGERRQEEGVGRDAGSTEPRGGSGAAISEASDASDASDQGEGLGAGGAPRPSRPRKRDLPGGLLVQICVHFGLRPGIRSSAMLHELREGFAQGDIEADQPYEYYMGVLELVHGAAPARPAEEIPIREGGGV